MMSTASIVSGRSKRGLSAITAVQDVMRQGLLYQAGASIHDPTFALIFDHTRAEDQFRRILIERPGDDRAEQEHCEAADAAHWKLLRTKPTTLGGCIAMLRHCVKEDRRGNHLDEERWAALAANIAASLAAISANQ